MLILFVGLVLAHALSFGLTIYERALAAQTMMLGYLEKDVTSSVAILDRIPAAERASWLKKLERRNYRYILGGGQRGGEVDSALTGQVAASMANVLGTHYRVTVSAIPGSAEHLQVHVQLSDGSPLTIDVSPSGMSLSRWLPLVLSFQLVLLAACTWFAVRLATRPLAQLAHAADALGPDLKGVQLVEDGPLEVARAASAFNAMQSRIAEYLTERMQILAAISHDLQTPITRMRLRTDLMDDCAQREKMQQDLDAMEALVREGVAYARSLHGATETPCRIDPDALLDSLVCDYQDAGQKIRLDGRIGAPLLTRPHALRRILMNLIDNALKFAHDVELSVQSGPAGRISMVVLDRGPGIPAGELEAVLRPFYRIEGSRNRNSGGTGLGLAIAHQLALALGAELSLGNRDGGGLEARLSLPATVCAA
jgi:signal transduction histidine kinase